MKEGKWDRKKVRGHFRLRLLVLGGGRGAPCQQGAHLHLSMPSALVHGNGAPGEDPGHPRSGQDWTRSGHPDAVLWHEGKSTLHMMSPPTVALVDKSDFFSVTMDVIFSKGLLVHVCFGGDGC